MIDTARYFKLNDKIDDIHEKILLSISSGNKLEQTKLQKEYNNIELEMRKIEKSKTSYNTENKKQETTEK